MQRRLLVEGEVVSIARIFALAKIFKWYGVVLLILAFVGLGIVYGPLVQEEYKFKFQNSKFKSNSNSKNVTNKPNWEVPDDKFSLYIPKIGAISRVIPNIDAGNKQEYLKALKMGVAQAAGLANPGEKGTIYLFAHSVASPIDYARYNAVFYLLDKLESGDLVEIYYQKKLYKYHIETREILGVRDVKYFKHGEEELLVLQTCWPPGTSWKRLVLTARPVMVY